MDFDLAEAERRFRILYDDAVRDLGLEDEKRPLNALKKQKGEITRENETDALEAILARLAR